MPDPFSQSELWTDEKKAIAYRNMYFYLKASINFMIFTIDYCFLPWLRKISPPNLHEYFSSALYQLYIYTVPVRKNLFNQSYFYQISTYSTILFWKTVILWNLSTNIS